MPFVPALEIKDYLQKTYGGKVDLANNDKPSNKYSMILGTALLIDKSSLIHGSKKLCHSNVMTL